MNKTRLLALTALLCAGAALPASAQPAYGPNDRSYGYDRPGGWDRIGSVTFSFRPDRETEYGNFGGRVERLSFHARNADVRCNRITATYANGRTSDALSRSAAARPQRRRRHSGTEPHDPPHRLQLPLARTA